ncbi:hypothetical protein Tco_0665111 [Tanacetum coccineum]
MLLIDVSGLAFRSEMRNSTPIEYHKVHGINIKFTRIGNSDIDRVGPCIQNPDKITSGHRPVIAISSTTWNDVGRLFRSITLLFTTASSSGNKKKGVEPIIEVSNSNTFEVLNSVDNDVELGTNGGTINLVNNGATSSGSSFINSTTPIIEKIGKFEELLTSGKVILMNEAGNPLKKVEYSGDYDSEDEVASVENDMARSMASERVGFDTQSLLKQ